MLFNKKHLRPFFPEIKLYKKAVLEKVVHREKKGAEWFWDEGGRGKK
jgi:hypothetical protein